MIIMMRGRVATHAFTADQFQEALPARQCAPGNVVGALCVLFFLSSDYGPAIQHPAVPVLAVFLTPTTQSGSGTNAVPISRSTTAHCDHACNMKGNDFILLELYLSPFAHCRYTFLFLFVYNEVVRETQWL